MEKRPNIRYSEAFKQEVVSQLESGKLESITAAGRRYGIKGATTIRRWVCRYGREDLIPTRKIIMKKDEINEVKELNKRVRELEKALATAAMKNLLGDVFLEMACERLDTDPEAFKKKHATMLSTPPRKGGKG